jgi:hypothetical protein
MMKFVPSKAMPLVSVLVLLLLGVFAFRNGVGSPTAAVTLENTTLSGALILDRAIEIPVEYADIRFNSATNAILETSGRSINVSGSVFLQGFTGTIAWDGESLVLEGAMARAQGTGVDVVWAKQEQTTITFPNGLIDITAMNLSTFKQVTSGKVTLEGRWTAQLNETPVTLTDFSGRVYLQHVSNVTTFGIEGVADTLRIKDNNILKLMT